MMCLPQETYPSSVSPTPPELTASVFESSEELRSGAHVTAPRPNSRCLKISPRRKIKCRKRIDKKVEKKESTKKEGQKVEKKKSTKKAEASPFNIGWIDRIYNNTNQTWYIKSVDDRHNGKLKEVGGREEIELDGGQWHALKPNTQYKCEWCGIPWFWNSDHFKRLSGRADKRTYVEIFQSSQDRKNWVYYTDQNGREVGRQQVLKDAGYHTWLKIEADGCALYMVNDDGDIVDTIKQLIDLAGEWVGASMKKFAEKILNKALGVN